MVRQLQAELLLDARAELAEGPVWDTRDDRLLWVDIHAGLVHKLDVESGVDQLIRIGSEVGAVVPRAQGGYLAAVRDGFVGVTKDGTVLPVATACGPGLRMNDGKCAPDGAFWAGTVADDQAHGVASLYRLADDGSVTVRLRGVTISNGLGFTDDGRLYYVDTALRRVDVFDVAPATQTLDNRRTFLQFPEAGGSPDGIALDNEGCVWVALWGGSAVHRYTPTGVLDMVIEVPAAHVTSCTFGGAAGDELFITTARAELTEAQLDAQPLAGGLFRCRPGVTGPAATPYAG